MGAESTARRRTYSPRPIALLTVFASIACACLCVRLCVCVRVCVRPLARCSLRRSPSSWASVSPRCASKALKLARTLQRCPIGEVGTPWRESPCRRFGSRSLRVNSVPFKMGPNLLTRWTRWANRWIADPRGSISKARGEMMVRCHNPQHKREAARPEEQLSYAG